ncbi:MAG: calcium/sodium antiporter [Eubacterium sp.]
MQLFQSFIILIIGFVFLIKGADFFVDGSASIAKQLRVPSLIVGMTVVAMGTSLPECSVSVTASLAGNNSLAISNAVGSNIFNLLMVCGICAIITPLAVHADTRKRDFPVSVICAILLLAAGWFGMGVNRIEGITLLVCFIIFLVIMIRSALKARAAGIEVEVEGEDAKVLPLWKSILFILLGGVAIKYGGDFVVDSASDIAAVFGMSQTLIGLTICAIGTSLPELVTSIVAARKNEVDMAVGNVIGSNIFNILLVLGIGSAISPIAFITENAIDLLFLIFISILCWIFACSRKEMRRGEGIVMVVLYVIYWIYICIR